MATTTKTVRRHFVAINIYRNSTSDGFGNTWRVAECNDRAHQIRVLRHGLPVTDSAWVDADGYRHASYSTMGLRIATPAEIRAAKRDEEYDPIRLCEHHVDGVDV